MYDVMVLYMVYNSNGYLNIPLQLYLWMLIISKRVVVSFKLDYSSSS
jgi:hypothetical protein